MRILAVTDSLRTGDAVGRTLRVAGHQVSLAASEGEASDELARASFALVIFDLGFPDASWLDLCRSLRAAGNQLPILMLSTSTRVGDRVAGLDAGADDYLVKPFAAAELVARVRALGRRSPRWTEGRRDYGRLRIDREERIVTLDGGPVALTTRELDIVALLAWRDGRIVSRDELVETIWGRSHEGSVASFNVLLTRIRRKLSPLGVEPIRTLRQVGYAWALERSSRG